MIHLIDTILPLTFDRSENTSMISAIANLKPCYT